MTKLDRPIALPVNVKEPGPVRPRGEISLRKRLLSVLKEHVRNGRSVIPSRVIPAKKKGGKDDKKPAIGEWQPYQTRLPTEAEIKAWEEGKTFPMNAIAMVTGGLSGYWVADADGPEALEYLEKNAPSTPLKALTLQGEHWYFKTPPAGHIKTDVKVLFLDLDVRGDGGLITLPPSVRRFDEGIYYRWKGFPGEPGQEVWESVPVWEGPPGTHQEGPWKADDSPAEPEDADGDAIIFEGEGRNSTLTSRVGGWVGRRFRKTAVMKAALDWDLKHCVPPLGQKEVRTIVESIWGIHYKQHGAPVKKNGDSIFIFSGPPPEGEENAKTASDEVPEKLLRPGGVLQSFMEYVEASSVLHIPLFALGAGLALIGTVMGGKVATETGLKTNFYVITLADSGEGKGAALGALKRVLNSHKDTKHFLGSSHLASDAALYSAVSETPVQLMLFDELGDFMNLINRRQGSSVSGVPKALKELFTCTDDGYVKSYANSERKLNIVWHNLSFFGTGVPSTFWNSLTVQDFEDGFLARNLILQHRSAAMPEPRDRVQKAVPFELTERLSNLAKTEAQTFPCPWRLALPEPWVIPKSPEAGALIKEAGDRFRKTAFASRDDPDKVFTLFNRALEYIEKTALVMAVNRTGALPERVEASDAEFAVSLMEHLLPKIITAARDNVSFSPQDKFRRQILKMIKNKGYVTVKDVYRNIRDCDSRQAEDALKILENQGRVTRGFYNNVIQYRAVTEKLQ